MSRRHIRLRMKDGSGPGKITDVARDGSPVVRHTRPLRKKGASSGRIVTGVYMANLRGYGFARPVDENWKDGDIYISRDCTNGAWDRDTVEVRLLPKVHGRKQSGTVTRILSRGVNEVIGTAERDGHVMLVIPDDLKLNRTVLIPDEARNGAKDGDKVLAEITDYGRGRHANPVGAVREVFGPADAPGVDIFAIARGENLPMEFSEKQLRQAERCPDHVLDSDFEGRRDLRDWQLVTIDGPDAKDLDDAVSLTEHPDGYTLGVHIADVSNYVQESSQLDREALRRGTSVYLADRVIPMLPEALSNGICSLNAGEDRLALSVIMELDRGGRVTAHEIVESVIRVGERMSYPDVQNILEENYPDLCRRYEAYVPLFRRMETVSALIRKRRMKRGAIDFDFPEAKIELDEKGIPTAILPENATVATRIIEDFMLTANETVAAEYRKRALPFLYRVHGEPDPDKVEELIAFVRKNGVEIDKKKQKITPREIQQALLRIKGQPGEALISRVILRTMQQACYDVTPRGHFGLAAKDYCHFTSPIRRYPDLQIHRIIRDDLHGRLNDRKIGHYREILPDVARQTSMTERRAQNVERETEKLKKCQYMLSHIGEIFDGVISGVTGWGLYVELPNTVEGLVSVSGMCDDDYSFDEEKRAMTGRLSRRSYTLGDPVRVRVQGGDLRTRTIEFELI